MRFHFHPSRKDITLESVLRALGDPVRLEMVRNLARKECQLPCKAVFEKPIAKSTLSHHFRILREAGIISTRSEGTQFFNCLRRDDLEARFPGLLDVILKATAKQKKPYVRLTATS